MINISAQKSLLEHDSFKDKLKIVKTPPKKQEENTEEEQSTTQIEQTENQNKNTLDSLITIPNETISNDCVKSASDSLDDEFENTHTDLQIDLSLLDERAFQNIDRLNVKDMELRDVLRGIAYQYKLNIVAGSDLREPVTLTLSNVRVIDCILFLIEEYDLKINQFGNILNISRKSDSDQKENKKMKIDISDGKLSVDVEEEELSNIVRFLSQTGNLNIIIENGVKGKVSGYFNNIELVKGIELLLKNNGFVFREKDNVYYVSYARKTYSDQDGKVSSLWVTVNDQNLISFDLVEADLMNVLQEISQQMDINLVTYETPSGKISAKCSDITLNEALDILFKGSDFTYKIVDDVYIVGNKKISGLVSNKLIKLNHIKAEGIPELLPDIVKRNATIKIIKEQNAIMAIATNDVITELENFLTQIDHPTPQILIEALVVDFSSTDIRELGLKMGTNRSSASDSTGWSNFSLLDVGINKDGQFYTQHDGNSVNEQLTNFSNWIGAKNIGVLPEDFYIQIQALESEGLADIRSKPQIATLNGHTASISIGTTQYYILTSTTPIASTEEIYTQETERFEKVEANVTLSITPWVSASGEVTVEIHPEFKTPVGTFNADTPPTINTRVIDSTVRLKDGESIILGGLIEDKKSKSYYKVPILGDIPILGALFRSRGKNDSKTEMMIYITPHVFYGDETDSSKWENLKNSYKLRND